MRSNNCSFLSFFVFIGGLIVVLSIGLPAFAGFRCESAVNGANVQKNSFAYLGRRFSSLIHHRRNSQFRRLLELKREYLDDLHKDPQTGRISYGGTREPQTLIEQMAFWDAVTQIRHLKKWQMPDLESRWMQMRSRPRKKLAKLYGKLRLGEDISETEIAQTVEKIHEVMNGNPRHRHFPLFWYSSKDKVHLIRQWSEVSVLKSEIIETILDIRNLERQRSGTSQSHSQFFSLRELKKYAFAAVKILLVLVPKKTYQTLSHESPLPEQLQQTVREIGFERAYRQKKREFERAFSRLASGDLTRTYAVRSFHRLELAVLISLIAHVIGYSTSAEYFFLLNNAEQVKTHHAESYIASIENRDQRTIHTDSAEYRFYVEQYLQKSNQEIFDSFYRQTPQKALQEAFATGF